MNLPPTVTAFQKEVLELIRSKPGEDQRWVAMMCSSPSAFAKAAHALAKKDLVYYHREGGIKKWWPIVKEESHEN